MKRSWGATLLYWLSWLAVTTLVILFASAFVVGVSK